MHGCGNDFLVVGGPVALDGDHVREICDRRRGVGADGILVVGAPEGRRWPVRLDNADGLLGESCGNGARCVARYLLDRDRGDSLVRAGRNTFELAGQAEYVVEGRVG